MNKKFLSAILFGALMVTSTGTFVSCKDYDDDIENLQGQINNLATKSDVEAKLSQLQAAIDAAKAESAANASKLAALEKCECDVDAMLAKVKESVDADMAAYKTELEALIKQAESLVGEIADFVTSVSLDYAGTTEAYDLDFFTITEKANVFEDGLAGALSFEAGKQTQVAKTGIVVRVNPTNAVLAPEMISLVNSKGENLDEYMNIKVEKYSKLLTRGASNNGLWVIKPELKEYKKEQFEALKYVDKKKNDDRYAYAVQINNALESAEARYVTSEYTIALDEWTSFEAADELLFTVDKVSVLDINNRYDATSLSLPKFNDASAKMYNELTWKASTEKYPTPAIEAVKKDGAWMNVTTDANDDRSDKKAALAVQGKAFTIAIDNGVKDDDYEGKIKGLYVTLDYKANAVESEPSEWNAWTKYDITGLNTVVEGTSTTITIDSEETINDFIGFRVYAVNLDGTLVDPDGRAFYVLVGEQAADAQTITATITPDNKNHSSVKVNLTAEQSEVITSLLKNQKNNPAVVMYEKNPVLKINDVVYPASYDVTFNKSNDGKSYVSATFTVNKIENFINDKTYNASIVYKNANGHELGTVNFELTKVMPTTFPADFAFRPKQETTDGSGKFIAYMINEGEPYVVAEEYATTGIKDLDNVFYGLDEYYKFVFATSKWDADKKVDVNSDAVTNADGYIHEVARGYIDNATSHAVSVWYTYPGISTYSYIDENGEEAWKHGATHEVAYDKALEAVYACWEDAAAWTWATAVVDKASVSLKPVLQWDATGTERSADLAAILSTNSYNNDYFGLDLEQLLNKLEWLAVREKDNADKAIKTIELTVNNQVNPYYVPSIEGPKIIFKQKDTQVDAAPTADHEEKLTITLVDAFGHRVVIALDVTVKAPEKK